MKYIKEYNNEELTSSNLIVVNLVKELGYDDTVVYLNSLLKNKYVTFFDSIVTKTETPNLATNSGTVCYFFYINSSGFIIARLADDKQDFYVDLIINRSTITCDEKLDYQNALISLNAKRYNL